MQWEMSVTFTFGKNLTHTPILMLIYINKHRSRNQRIKYRKKRQRVNTKNKTQ